MAILTLTLSSSFGISEKPPFTFSLNDYGKTNVVFSMEPGMEKWSNSYVDLIKTTESQIKKVDEVSASLLGVGDKDIQDYRRNYVVAAEFNKSTEPMLNAMFSSTAIHSAPISLNLMTNSILKTKFSNKSIVATNHPFTRKAVSINFLNLCHFILLKNLFVVCKVGLNMIILCDNVIRKH